MLLQPRPTRYMRVVYFREQRARRGSQVAADRKSQVGYEAVAETASPSVPSMPQASRRPGAPAMRHGAGTKATPSPRPQLKPILAVTSHLLGSMEHNYKSSKPEFIF